MLYTDVSPKMYTLHTWYFNKDGNLYYHHITQAATSAEAKLCFEDELKSDKRLLEVLIDPVMEIAFGYDTNIISCKSVEPPPLAYFLMSCSFLEMTLQQTNVAKWMHEGVSNKIIAEKLGCGEQAVRNHITDIGKKIDAKGRAAILYKIKDVAKGLQRKS